MSIRSKLYFLILLFGVALLINLIVLGFLVRTATTSLTTANVALQQQSTAVQMQAQLRDAEAALYRYEIEGEAGFATRFRDQLNLFEAEVENYAKLAATPDELQWLGQLRMAHDDAQTFGETLIEQRNLQTTDLHAIEAIRTRAASLLTGVVAEPNDVVAQRVLEGMALNLREAPLALRAYLDTPREIDRVRFVDSVSTFRSYHAQFTGDGGLSAELAQSIDDLEQIGTQMISRRVQHKADYANFALLLFQTGQGIIVDEIQPQATASVAQAETVLNRAIRLSLGIIFATIVVTSIVFLSVIFPLVQRMNSSILALVRGADAVTEGEYETNVSVGGEDEFQRLATAFNNMTDDLAARELRLRELLNKLSLVQEEERRLVGLDLHDGLTQMLLSANMHLNAFASKFHNGNGANGEAQLERGRTRLQEAINEARWVVSELRPTDLEDYGLIDGLAQYVHKVAAAQQWEVGFSADLQDYELTPSAETVIFRIVQEALSNARKYAATQRIKVRLDMAGDDIRLTIKDWGKGFDTTQLIDTAEHLGVLGMAERAELVHGHFAIESELNAGTTISVTIPLGVNLRGSADEPLPLLIGVNDHMT